MSELLLKLQSSMLLAADVRPSVLFIFDDKIVFRGNIGVLGGQETILNYDQVAQVNQHKGLIEGSLEIINSGGRNSITIEHVTNADGDRAKLLIDQRANLARDNVNLPPPPTPPGNSSDQQTQKSNQSGVELLDELANLKDQGILTDEEFEEKKRQILSRI